MAERQIASGYLAPPVDVSRGFVGPGIHELPELELSPEQEMRRRTRYLLLAIQRLRLALREPGRAA